MSNFFKLFRNQHNVKKILSKIDSEGGTKDLIEDLDFLSKTPKSSDGLKILSPNPIFEDFEDFLDPQIKSSKLWSPGFSEKCRHKKFNSTRNFVEIATIGHDGKSKKRVTKKAHYSDRIWAATNPNFLLSGQVSAYCVLFQRHFQKYIKMI